MKNKKDELYYIERLMKSAESLYDRLRSCKTERNVMSQRRHFRDTFDMLEYFYKNIPITYKIFHHSEYISIGGCIDETKSMILESFESKEKELCVKRKSTLNSGR